MSETICLPGVPSQQALATPSLIVGLGASAGGIEALERFFRHMPPDSGAAFVVVQHLSPDFRSLMDELLGRWTTMQVWRVEDSMRVEPDTVYVIPPRKEMIFSAGRLLLTDNDPSVQIHLPIDAFFRSLAREAGKVAVGVVLSGTGSDGSRGIVALRNAGALVIAQRPESAKFDGMPRSAIETGVADQVADPEQIPDILLARMGRSSGPDGQAPAPSRDGMEEVFRLLAEACGIDFSDYKPETVTRRIERRINMLQSADLSAYVERLRNHREELNALYRDLLIGVTRFFRDPEFFDYLRHDLLPTLLQAVPPNTEFRAWVAGCATGEEAYTLAIILRETLEEIGREMEVKIFATDVHSASLERASAAEYPAESLEGMDAQRRERYFVMNGGGYRVVPELRKMVVFATHNLLRDPPFRALDLITCRNLLIYLKPTAQQKVVSLFHFGLKPRGTLFLGSSEGPTGLQDEFEILQSRFKVYRKRREVQVLNTPLLPVLLPRRPRDNGGEGDPVPRLPLGGMIKLYDALLARYMPAAFLINHRRELQHTFGGAGRWLVPVDGRPTLDLLDLLNPKLKAPVTAGVQRALKERRSVLLDTPRGGGENPNEVLRIHVDPVPSREQDPFAYLLIAIEPREPPVAPEPEVQVASAELSVVTVSGLEEELRYTRESLQATIEELETSNEELQATNEELVASNEEMQSTNEELQSVNEELYTVNAELQRKIAELSELTNDMDNLLVSTEVGTIFLDSKLCLRRITPKISETFNLLPQDLGRSIESFTSNLNHDGMLADLHQVLESGERVEREVRDRAGHWFFLRILPYRSAGTIAGVVLTLVDIDTLKAAEDALFRERHLLRSLMDTLPDSVYFRDRDGRFILINQAMAERVGLATPELATGKQPSQCCPPCMIETLEQDQVVVMERGLPIINHMERFTTPDGRAEWLLSTKLPLRDHQGHLVGMFSVARDITEQKHAQDTVQQELERRDEFIAILSHELRNPLAAIFNAAQILGMDAVDRVNRARTVEIIRRQSAQMARLMDDLLDISRLSHGKIRLRKELLDLRTALADAIAGVRPLAEQHRVTLREAVLPAPLYLDADPARIQQAFANLLQNAVRYNRQEGEVAIEVADLGDGQVRVSVRDTGIGIASELLPRVFDVFVQSTRGPHSLDSGLGVGLTLVRGIVELHGGEVTAASDGPDQGSVFHVVLPLAPSEAWPTTEISPPAMDPPTLDGTILLVEDSEDNRRLLSALLQHHGYQVHTAASGEEGLEVVEHLRPSQILLDIGLPGIDGYEVARRLRARLGEGTPRLIALTGYGQPDDRATAQRAGFDAYLVKPVMVEQLTEVLAEHQARV